MRTTRLSGVVAVVVALAAAFVAAPNPARAATSTPRVSVAGGSVVEGQMTHRYIKFVVTLSRPSAATVTVPYSTADDSATAVNVDYKPKSGSLVFKPGQTSKGVAVVVWPDRVDESDEQFQLNLGVPTNADLGFASAAGTIFDDDPNVGPRVAIGDGEIVETCAGPTPRAIVLVTLSIMQTVPVTVQVSTVPGTASAGSDYTTYSKTIVFSASQSLKEVKIPITPDTAVEGDESFTVNLTVTGGPVPASRSTGTVVVHDCDPS